MKLTEIKTFYDYNYWANGRILETAAKAPASEFTTPALLSHGSLRGTLAHILGAEWLWRMRFQQGISPTGMPKVDEFPELASLRARWQSEEQAMREFLGSIDDSGLERVVGYTNTRGSAFQTPLWQILLHVVNHGTQFRSEAAVWLTQKGYSPGDLDFIAFLRL